MATAASIAKISFMDIEMIETRLPRCESPHDPISNHYFLLNNKAVNETRRRERCSVSAVLAN